MLTPKGIITAVKTLEAAGIMCPGDVKALASVWQAVLADLTDEDLQAATVGYLRSPECRYGWPKPGQLLALVPRRQIEQARGGITGAEAWNTVMVEVRRFSPYNPHTPTWPCHPERFQRLLRGMGGLHTLSMTDEDQLPWRGKEFARQWDAMSETQSRVDAADNVIALADHAARRRLLPGGGS